MSEKIQVRSVLQKNLLYWLVSELFKLPYNPYREYWWRWPISYQELNTLSCLSEPEKDVWKLRLQSTFPPCVLQFFSGMAQSCPFKHTNAEFPLQELQPSLFHSRFCSLPLLKSKTSVKLVMTYCWDVTIWGKEAAAYLLPANATITSALLLRSKKLALIVRRVMVSTLGRKSANRAEERFNLWSQGEYCTRLEKKEAFLSKAIPNVNPSPLCTVVSLQGLCTGLVSDWENLRKSNPKAGGQGRSKKTKTNKKRKEESMITQERNGAAGKGVRNRGIGQKCENASNKQTREETHKVQSSKRGEKEMQGPKMCSE